ncbi:MAG: hypothetical protein NVSMB33_08150 [Ktedonobacteraceae bacterium]
MKKLIAAFVLFSLVAMFVVACGSSASGSGCSGVHMGENNFLQSSITIRKGSSINLIDDVQVPHIVTNGSWSSNNDAKPGKESGAPAVNQQFNGGDNYMIGPFNTAGTYHLYCTVHPGMNLTVIVK